jgi:hypothetical protein
MQVWSMHTHEGPGISECSIRETWGLCEHCKWIVLLGGLLSFGG